MRNTTDFNSDPKPKPKPKVVYKHCVVFCTVFTFVILIHQVKSDWTKQAGWVCLPPAEPVGNSTKLPIRWRSDP